MGAEPSRAQPAGVALPLEWHLKSARPPACRACLPCMRGAHAVPAVCAAHRLGGVVPCHVNQHIVLHIRFLADAHAVHIPCGKHRQAGMQCRCFVSSSNKDSVYLAGCQRGCSVGMISWHTAE